MGPVEIINIDALCPAFVVFTIAASFIRSVVAIGPEINQGK